MTEQLRDQLQATLSGSYTLERELGGGGMSRVFVAEELRLRRKVVVKVLSPELAQGISVERFEREIQTVAALQHANIVPVHTAGDTNGLPFYTMPFVEGESLRGRLGKGPLAVTEVIGILRDVSKALAYAHQRGVVHRDIKPDNVLISGGVAVVTDFGIAKAISASRTASGNATLTQVGTSIGTPAYMAPEQAAGEADVDHRADIYALGAMAYELLAGQAVFAGRTAQRMLAAHMGESPKPVTEFRGDLPPALSELVMQCLAKDPNDRPQSAGDIARVLETITSGSGMPAMPPVLLGGPAMFRKALALYAVAFVAVAILAKAAIVGIGLPDWVFPGSLIVMALGLPVVLWTGYVQRVTRRAITMTPTYTPGGSPSTTAHGTMATMALKAAPHVSWHRTARGGMYALGAFVLIIGTFMVMRAFGIGPAASLFGAGKLKHNEPLLVAEFSVKGGADSSLGGAVAEAVRADLGQSNVIQLVPASAIAATLKLMQRAPTSRIDLALAREIAQRSGARAVVTGDLTPLGAGFIVGLRLISSEQGDPLASFQATADGPSQLIPTVQKLTRELRGKIGESLRAVNASAPLAEVTTPSLDALKKYEAAARVNDYASDYPKAIALLKEAVAIDTAFAMAWRKLAAVYQAARYPAALGVAAADQAYRFRDRLTENERLSAVGYYFERGSGRDRAKAAAAYEALQERGLTGPHTHNLGNIYSSRREYARAESLFRQNIERGLAPAVSFSALWSSLVQQGRFAAADSVGIEMRRRFPTYETALSAAGLQAWNRGDLDSARATFDRLRANANPTISAAGYFWLGQDSRARGRIADADRLEGEQWRANAARGADIDTLAWRMDAARSDIWWRERPDTGVKQLDDALARMPLRSRPLEQRPYAQIATLYAQAGRSDRAKQVLAQFDAEVRDTSFRRAYEPALHAARGEIALAEKRPGDALQEFRQADRLPDGPANSSPLQAYAALGRAFDQANRPDSTVAYFERYLSTPFAFRLGGDATNRAGIEKRLGELYESQGNMTKAAEHYRAFIELWKNADPELQPRVAEARRRLAKLVPVERSR